MRRLSRVIPRPSYANVIATLALFASLGGTSYAVSQIGSDDVENNSLRSRDIRDDTVRSRDVRDRGLRARDIRPDGLGSGAIKESSLGTVPRASAADRVGGATAQDLRVRCPTETLFKAGACIERTARSPASFLGATSQCDAAGRGLVTMPQLDRFARSNALPQAEWTSSVYRNTDNGPDPFDQLETVVLTGGAVASYDKVNAPIQHAFRCVALPSN